LSDGWSTERLDERARGAVKPKAFVPPRPDRILFQKYNTAIKL